MVLQAFLDEVNIYFFNGFVIIFYSSLMGSRAGFKLLFGDLRWQTTAEFSWSHDKTKLQLIINWILSSGHGHGYEISMKQPLESYDRGLKKGEWDLSSLSLSFYKFISNLFRSLSLPCLDPKIVFQDVSLLFSSFGIQTTATLLSFLNRLVLDSFHEIHSAMKNRAPYSSSWLEVHWWDF